jgi:hypothetical protein
MADLWDLSRAEKVTIKRSHRDQAVAITDCAIYGLVATLKSVAIELGFLLLATVRAALRLVLKTFFFVEFLFAIGEYEFFGAVLADESFVGHVSVSFFSGSNILV